MLLDSQGRIIRSGGLDMGPNLARIQFRPGCRVHDALHPGCEDPVCDFQSNWTRAWHRHADGLALEWETDARPVGIRLRLRLQPVSYACQVLFADAVDPFRDCSVLFVRDIGHKRGRPERSSGAGRAIAGPHREPPPALGEPKEMRLHRVGQRSVADEDGERRRIAAELHDGLGQMLSLLRLEIEACLEIARRRGGPAECEGLELAHRYALGSLDELRRVTRNLRPSVLDELGLIGALELLVSEFRMVCPDVMVHLELAIVEAELPNHLVDAIYRISQEAIHNVARHAAAGRATLVLASSDDGVELAIRDDGVGPPDAGFPRRGYGFINMRERTEQTGGRFSYGGSPGKGCTVRANWSSEAVRLMR